MACLRPGVGAEGAELGCRPLVIMLHLQSPSYPLKVFSLLQHINPVAASLIQKMLQTDPTARPPIHELLNDEFFTSGYIPARLPITCLTIPPRFSIAPSSLEPSNRKPLTVLNKGKMVCVSWQRQENPGWSCMCGLLPGLQSLPIEWSGFSVFESWFLFPFNPC